MINCPSKNAIVSEEAMEQFCREYVNKLSIVLDNREWSDVQQLAGLMFDAWRDRRQLLICGNGGSAGNAIHLANDLLYGVGGDRMPGMKVEALSANPSVLTCLGNDIGYENIFSEQLRSKAEIGDMLIVLSGSGNSENVVRALDVANNMKMRTVAIVGYSGGRCLELAELSIHFAINDMQICEDLQLIVGHMCMQWLDKRSKENV